MKKLVYGLLALLAITNLQGQKLKTIKSEIQHSIDNKKEK